MSRMIRPARPADVPAIYRMIRDLAEYERSLPEVTGTEEDLRQSLFGPDPKIFAHLAEYSGQVAGFALWFVNYSTWTGRHGIYLEDLYVAPDLRGHGLGRALLAELAALCVERGYARVEWWVLDWNEPALGFYTAIGAVPMSEWTVHRLTGEPLRAMAASRRPPDS
jgi:GNAT superfamily N-acetyltransferase